MSHLGLVVAIAIPIGSFLLSVLAWHGSNKAQSQSVKIETLKVEADAYDRAQIIYDKAVAQVQGRNDRLAAQLRACEARVDQLEKVLLSAGIRLPFMSGAHKRPSDD